MVAPGTSPVWHTRPVTEGLTPITRESLWRMLESGDELAVIDALSPLSYALSHLPGAISMQPENVAERAPRRIPDLDTTVVVYCSSATCDSSVLVAQRLVDLGYRDVRHYEEGKEDWVAAGLPLEGSRA